MLYLKRSDIQLLWQNKEEIKMEKAMTLESSIRVLKPFPLQEEGSISTFYVDTMAARGDDPVSKISFMLSNGEGMYQKFLFIGHSGSGKSTELNRMRNHLKDNYETICFSIEDELDIQDFDYTDFIFALLATLLDYSNEHHYGIKEETITNLYDYWTNETILETVSTDKCAAEASVEAKWSFLKKLTAKVTGVLATGVESKRTVRQIVEPRMTQLISQVNDIFVQMEQASEKKKAIIIIDDLDKLEMAQAQNLFLYHRRAITALRINAIFTFPIYLFYSPSFMEVRDDFDSYQLLSMIKVHEKSGAESQQGIDTIKSIIYRRVSENLFNAGVVDYAIKKAGGCLRDTFFILLNGILNAKVEDIHCQQVDLASIEKAYAKLKNTYERFTAQKYVDALTQLYNDPLKKPIENNNEIMELLQATAVIEYNGERWCDLHPAVVDFLHEKGII